MAAENTVREHADLVVRVMNGLCTRTLDHIAREAQLDGESLKDTVDRYEIDFAWHVLGSDRLRDATVAQLEARLQCAATDAQKACVADVLASAATQQAPEVLMSFDNDVAGHLADLLCATWQVAPAAVC